MKAKEKAGYVRLWQGYIKELYALSWVHNQDLSKEIKNHIQELNNLVEKVADDKIKGGVV